MLAGHVDAILVKVAANDTCVLMGSLAHHRGLDFACVGLVGADLEHRLVLDFKHGRFLTLHRQPLPSAIGRAHVLDVVSALGDADG